MNRIRILAVAAVAMIALALATQPVAGQSNLLRNPDFEGGFYAWNGDNARQVPNEWAAWWNTALAGPRYNPSDAGSRVQSGARAASYWEQYRDYDAGLYQLVPNVTSGTIYRFSIYGHAWSTTDITKKTSDTDVQMQIGIDPKGGDNPNAGSIVWSGAVSARDTYQLFTVEAAAQGTQISVWVRGKTIYPVTQTDFYWDNASLVAVGQAAAPTNTPKPSGGGGGGSGSGGGGSQGGCSANSVPAGSIQQATPQPDGSIIHTVQRCETLTGIAVTYGLTLDEIRRLNNLQSDVLRVGQQLVVRAATEPTPAPAPPTPTPGPTSVAEQPSGGEGGQPAEGGSAEVVDESAKGSICVMSYNDLNGNGLREPEEPKQPGVTFAVSSSAATVGTYTTNGLDEPYCFTELDAGTYIVSWVGDNLTPTSEQTWAASVAPGATVIREFGVSTGQAAGESDASGGASRGGLLPVWATALIGAAGMVLFLTGAGIGGYFLLLRRQPI